MKDRHREINERQLQGRFGNLKETLPTNLATNRGLPEVLDAIKYQICRLPHIGTALPKTWVQVRETLENDPRDYIDLTEFLDICQDNGFTLLKDKMQLSGYLHDLGVCLHFQEDSLLRKTVILNPSWGTDAVYKVLDNHAVIHNRGRFRRADLDAIWDDPKYADKQDELLQLMISFKLCYQIPDSPGAYISPHLLAENQPEYDWEEADNLILRYTYDFLPKGIVTRFIVAMHPWIEGQELVWKTGVILDKDQTRAEVIEDYGRREIKLRVSGRHKKELMTIATHELDKIHDSFNRLKPSKWIPCNCVTCGDSQEPHSYPLETLREFADSGQATIQCQRSSYEMVNVLGLIDDVIAPEMLAARPDIERRRSGVEFPQESEAAQEVYISYAWGGRSEEIADQLDIPSGTGEFRLFETSGTWGIRG
jgi:hypothetical protein